MFNLVRADNLNFNRGCSGSFCHRQPGVPRYVQAIRRIRYDGVAESQIVFGDALGNDVPCGTYIRFQDIRITDALLDRVDAHMNGAYPPG